MLKQVVDFKKVIKGKLQVKIIVKNKHSVCFRFKLMAWILKLAVRVCPVPTEIIMENKEDAEIPKANGVIVGDIYIADEYDPAYPGEAGVINEYKRALVIQFPDNESIREAMKSKKVEFTVFGT